VALIVDKWVTIGAWQLQLDTNVRLKNGDWLDISASGAIWAGVWFTGTNGPRGWEGWTAGNDKPLPGSPPFSLLGRTSEDGYFYIGDGLRRTYQNTSVGPGETQLSVALNDNDPNGTGAFTVHIMVWRNPDAVVALQTGEAEEVLFRGEGTGERVAARPAGGAWTR
jgi:hypothetical protein